MEVFTETFTERTILLRYSVDLKIILLDHQNNFVGVLKIIRNAVKNLDILALA